MLKLRLVAVICICSSNVGVADQKRGVAVEDVAVMRCYKRRCFSKERCCKGCRCKGCYSKCFL